MAANSKIVTASSTVSPKVFWPVVVGLVLTFVAAAFAAITPDMLSAVGPLAVPLAVGLAALAQAITGYLKSDELRAIGVEATAAILPDTPVTSDVVPDVEDVTVDEPDTAGELEAELNQIHVDGAGKHRAEGSTAREV